MTDTDDWYSLDDAAAKMSVTPNEVLRLGATETLQLCYLLCKATVADRRRWTRNNGHLKRLIMSTHYTVL